MSKWRRKRRYGSFVLLYQSNYLGYRWCCISMDQVDTTLEALNAQGQLGRTQQALGTDRSGWKSRSGILLQGSNSSWLIVCVVMLGSSRAYSVTTILQNVHVQLIFIGIFKHTLHPVGELESKCWEFEQSILYSSNIWYFSLWWGCRYGCHGEPGYGRQMAKRDVPWWVVFKQKFCWLSRPRDWRKPRNLAERNWNGGRRYLCIYHRWATFRRKYLPSCHLRRNTTWCPWSIRPRCFKRDPNGDVWQPMISTLRGPHGAKRWARQDHLPLWTFELFVFLASITAIQV